MKDLTLLSDEELQLKYKRFKEYQESLWQKESELSGEIQRRKLLSALKVIGDIPWRYSLQVLQTPLMISLFLYTTEGKCPEEFLQLFHSYHSSISLQESIGFNIYIHYDDGEIHLTGNSTELIRFIKTYKLSIEKMENTLNVERKKLTDLVKELDDITYILTGKEILES